MEWHSAWVLLSLLVLPLLGWWLWRRPRTAALRFSDTRLLATGPLSWRARSRGVLAAARLVCLALLIVALARPRKGTALETINTEAVAMEIVVDHSSSMAEQMQYEDQALNRLQVVQRVGAEFLLGNNDDLKGRPGDLIGLVQFARYADTLCPLVTNHSLVADFLRDTDIVQLRSEDGTAIGAGIQLAAARLQRAEQQIRQNNARLMAVADEDTTDPELTIKSKVIILLTDGRETVGRVDPLAAAAMAADWGIRIYTIGIGAPQRSFFGVQGPDERLLKAIAQKTGGFYGLATDGQTLRNIYEKIDELEKTEIKSVRYVDYAERFGPWALVGLAVLLAEIAAGTTIWRKIP